MPIAYLQTRSASVTPTSLDAGRRTVEVTFATGSPVRRRGLEGDFFERLSIDPRHVDMARLESGDAPVLNSHRADDARQIVGVVESAELRDGRGIARLRFAEDADADTLYGRIRQGIIRNVSVGYRVFHATPVDGERSDNGDSLPTLLVDSWQPYEVSIVAMGADTNARIRSTDGADSMDRQTTSEILQLVRVAQLPITFAEDLIQRDVTIEDARAEAWSQMARRSNGAGGPQPGAGYVDVGDRGSDRLIEHMREGLSARMMGTEPSEAARPFTRMALSTLGREYLQATGRSTRMMTDSRVIDALLETRSGGLHTTSDFPGILADSASKTLMAAFNEQRSAIIGVARRGTLTDFKPSQRLQLDSFPSLTRVNEHGEFTRGTISEGGEMFRLATFGRVFGVSRQALVNDDLDALSRAMQSGGRAAARLIADQLVAALESTAVMSDGFPVFHANHGNLSATGAAITLASVAEGIQALREQMSLDGHLLNLEARWLIVAPAREAEARQFVASIQPATIADVQPFTLVVVVDARLEAGPWYIAAEPTPGGLEYFFLAGDEGPFVESRSGFDVDGIETKVRLDLAAGVSDYRTLFKNPGA